MALVLRIALDSLAGIINAPSPTDREAEHARQHRERTIGVGWRTRPELVVPTVDVGMRDCHDLRATKDGKDVGGDLLAVDALRCRPLARQVVLLEALTEVGHGGRRSSRFLLANRIAADVDRALEAFGFFARRRHGPSRVAADRELPPSAISLAPIFQDERTRPGGRNAGAEARHRGVKGDLVALLGRTQAP